MLIIRKSLETKCRLMVVRGWDKGEIRSNCLMEKGVSSAVMKMF